MDLDGATLSVRGRAAPNPTSHKKHNTTLSLWLLCRWWLFFQDLTRDTRVAPGSSQEPFFAG